MKIKILLAASIFSLITACSSDTIDNENTEPTPYFSNQNGNFWTYKIPIQGMINRDSLYIANDTTINNKVYKKMKTKNTPNGFYAGSLNKNSIRNSNGKVLLSGTANFNFGNVIPFEINVLDLPIFSEIASANQELGSVSGTTTQTFMGYLLNIDYVLRTTALESLSSFTAPNNIVYSDIKKVKLTLNLKITTPYTVSGVTFPVVFLPAQDVVVSTQYYVKNKGMAYAKTDINYQLQDLSQFNITLPIPQTSNHSQDEFLDTYLSN